MIDEDTERSKGYEWMVLSVSEGFLAWRARWPTVPFLIIQSERSEVREEDWRPSHSYHYPPNRWAWVRSSPHASSSTVTKESEMEWQRSDITFPNQIFYYHIRRAATDERSEEEPEPVMWTPRKRGYEWPSAAHITHYHFINSLFLSLGVGRHYQSHVIYLVCRTERWRPATETRVNDERHLTTDGQSDDEKWVTAVPLANDERNPSLTKETWHS